MPETLSITVNRDGLHDIEAVSSFETDGSFTISLANQGAPIHLHLHLDDELSDVATLEATNHYVEADSTRSVGVTVRGDGSASGKLKIVTGYGAETTYVDVSVVESDEREDSIPVDDALGRPQRTRRPAARERETASEFRKNLPLVALGAFALVLAAAAVTLVDGVAALFGAFVVLVGGGVAVYFLR